MILRASGQPTIFFYMLLSGSAGGLLSKILDFFKGEFSDKVRYIVFDFISVLSSFCLYMLLDLKLENGNKRFYTVVAYVLGVLAVTIPWNIIKKKLKERKKNV